MTREEKLYSMTMKALVLEAEKIGVKVDKKGSKQKAVEKMLAAEAESLKKELVEQAQAVANEEKTLSIPMPMEYTENGPQMIEKAEEQPQKKERKSRKKKTNPDRDNFYIKAVEEIGKVEGCAVKTWERIPNLIAVKAGKKTVAEIRFGLKGWTLNIHNDMVNALNINDYTTQKYYLPAVVKFNYDNWDAFTAFTAELA